MNIRFVYLSLTGIAACMGLAPVVDAQATYTLTEIGDPNASYTQLGGINSSGEIAGASDGRPFVWRNGELIDLSSSLSGYVTPAGINDLGQITGRHNGPSWGFLFSDGVVTDLGTVKHSYVSNPDGLNNLGEVVFVALVFPPDTPEVFHWSYIYRNGEYEQVPTLGGTYSRARAINNSGAAAGDATTTSDAEVHAIVYQNGQTFDLGTLGGSNAAAYDINEAGYTTGYSYTAGSTRRAFIANPVGTPGGRMIDLGVLPGSGRNSYGEAINNLNQIVGASEINADSTAQHAFVYTDGTMWNLNKLIHPKDPLRGKVLLTAAHGINDGGWIIASGQDERNPDASKTYLLRPAAQ